MFIILYHLPSPLPIHVQLYIACDKRYECYAFCHCLGTCLFLVQVISFFDYFKSTRHIFIAHAVVSVYLVTFECVLIVWRFCYIRLLNILILHNMFMEVPEAPEYLIWNKWKKKTTNCSFYELSLHVNEGHELGLRSIHLTLSFSMLTLYSHMIAQRVCQFKHNIFDGLTYMYM